MPRKPKLRSASAGYRGRPYCKAQELCIPIDKDCVLPRVARSLGKVRQYTSGTGQSILKETLYSHGKKSTLLPPFLIVLKQEIFSLNLRFICESSSNKHAL